MTKATWESIKAAIAEEISNGTYEPGDRLPTEGELAERYQAGRHSVRRAVAALARESKLSVEQGRGTFVEAAPLLRYAIGKRTRLQKNFHNNEIERKLILAQVLPAPSRVQKALQLAPDALVSEDTRLTLADGVPIASGRSYHSEDRFPGYNERRSVMASVTETYRSFGIKDYLRGDTRLYSRPARPEEAKLLKQHEDMPVLVVHATDTLLDGTPIAFKQVIWSAARVQFSFGDTDDDA